MTQPPLSLYDIAAAAYLNTVSRYGVQAVDPVRFPKSVISLAKANGMAPSFHQVLEVVQRVLAQRPTEAPGVLKPCRHRPLLKAPEGACMRLAPSPSKSAHLGHVYLMALHTVMLKNQPTASCILRFEDTDTTPGRNPSAQSVLSFASAVRWLGLKPSEVYFASSRVQRHLEILKPHVQGDLIAVSHGRKGLLTLGGRPVFRAGKGPHPLSTRYSWPIYHVQNVIDDYLDGVTYILRGTDLKPSHGFHQELRKLLIGDSLPKIDYVGRLCAKDGAVLKGRALKRTAFLPPRQERWVWRLLRSHALSPSVLGRLGQRYLAHVLKGPFTGDATIETLLRLRVDPAPFLDLVQELRFSENTRYLDHRFYSSFEPSAPAPLPSGPRSIVVHQLFTGALRTVMTVQKKHLKPEVWYVSAKRYFFKVGKKLWCLPLNTEK